MDRKSFEALGLRVRRKRGELPLRQAAERIGIAAATLLRVEEGRVPDLETFSKLCAWLGAAPSEFIGASGGTGQNEAPLTAHFKVQRELLPPTAEALARMVMLVSKQQVKTNSQLPPTDA